MGIKLEIDARHFSNRWVRNLPTILDKKRRILDHFEIELAEKSKLANADWLTVERAALEKVFEMTQDEVEQLWIRYYGETHLEGLQHWQELEWPFHFIKEILDRDW